MGKGKLAEVVERLHPQLRAIASRLRYSMTDDLVSEMALAIIMCEPGQTDAYYLQRAKDRARNFLRADRRQRHLERRRENRAACVPAETPSERVDRGGSFPTMQDICDIYDQDADFLEANLGWD